MKEHFEKRVKHKIFIQKNNGVKLIDLMESRERIFQQESNMNILNNEMDKIYTKVAILKFFVIFLLE